MQRSDVPLRVIDGAVDPISGEHMVTRYRELIPDADTVLLTDIGHYPQIEAPCQVLEHYLRVSRPVGVAATRSGVFLKAGAHHPPALSQHHSASPLFIVSHSPVPDTPRQCPWPAGVSPHE